MRTAEAGPVEAHERERDSERLQLYIHTFQRRIPRPPFTQRTQRGRDALEGVAE